MIAYLFLLLIIFFVILPLLRGVMAVNRFRRQTRDAFRKAFEQGQQRSQRPDSTPQRKSKKIGKDVGEYVSYEEIAGSTRVATPDGQRVRVEVEQQVVDAEWEEVRS